MPFQLVRCWWTNYGSVEHTREIVDVAFAYPDNSVTVYVSRDNELRHKLIEVGAVAEQIPRGIDRNEAGATHGLPLGEL